MARSATAAVLGVLVQTKGVVQTSKDLGRLDGNLRQTARTASGATGTIDKHGKAVQRMGGQVGAATKKVAGFVGAYAGYSAVKSAISTTEELAKTVLLLTKNYGLSTKAASEWGSVAKARGIDSKQLTMSFKGLGTAVRGAVGGSKAQVQAFKELGISAKDVKTHGNDLNAMLGMVSDGLQKLGPGTNRSVIQAKLFGRTWQQLSPLLRDGSGELNKQLGTAEKYGAVLGGKGVNAVKEHIAAEREWKLAIMGIQVTLGQVLIPTLSKVFGAMATFVLGVRQGTGAGGQLRDAVMQIIGALAPLGQSIGQIVGWLQQHQAAAKVLIPVMIGLAVAIWAVDAAMSANPATQFVLALAAVTLAVVTAYRESATFRSVVDTLFNALKTGASAAAPIAVAAFNGIMTGVSAVARAFTAAVGWVKGAMTSISTEIHKWDVLATVVKTALAVMTTIMAPSFAVLVGAVHVGMALITAAFRTAWGVIKAIFSGFFIAAKALIAGGAQVLHGAVLILGGILKGDFHQIWAGIKDIFTGSFKAIKGLIDGQVKTLSGAAAAVGNGIKDAIGGALGAAVEAARGFINSIIGIMNKVLGALGIDKIPTIGGGAAAGPKSTGKDPHNVDLSKTKGGLARGGAFGRTGGFVDRPVVMMGEEAPRHPEYVIPTNPAYRGRAKGLLAQAAGAIGMAKGGIYSQAEMAQLWIAAGGPASQAQIAGAVGMAESRGDSQIVNSIGATGLMQIHPAEPGSLDPLTNMRQAVRKWNERGWLPWEAYTNGNYKQFLGGKGGGGIIGAIGGLLGGVGGAIGSLISGGAEALIGKLPDVSKLPDWMGGVGKYMLGKVGSWVKDKFKDLIGLGGGGGGGGATRGPKGVGSFGGVPMANWVVEALQYAASRGVAVRPTSGYRPGFDPHTATGASEHQGIQYPHGAVDFGGYTTGGDMKRAVVAATSSFKYPLLNPIGFHDEGHASGTGHARGGKIMPYVGAFKNGGYVNQTGMALVHKGETVQSAMAQGGVISMLQGGAIQLVNGQWAYVDHSGQVHQMKVTAEGQFYKTTSGKWATLAADTPVVGVPAPLKGGEAINSGGGGGGGGGDGGAAAEAIAPEVPVDTTPYSQADIDALNASIQALTAQLETIERQNELNAAELAASRRDVAVSQSQYATLAKAIADVASGQIGGRVGLGFQSPSYAGGGVRY